MTTIILNALSITYKVYDDYRQSSFQNWCAKYAYEYDISLRLLVTNNVLYNWYLMSWNQNVEQAFIAENKKYLDAQIDDPGTYKYLFFKFPVTIHKYYPKSLLNKIRVESRFKTEFKTRNA